MSAVITSTCHKSKQSGGGGQKKVEKIISFLQGQEIGSKLERLHEYISEYSKGKKIIWRGSKNCREVWRKVCY